MIGGSVLHPIGLQLGIEKTFAEGGWIHEVLNKDEHFLSRYIVNAIFGIILNFRDTAIIRNYRDISMIFFCV